MRTTQITLNIASFHKQLPVDNVSVVRRSSPTVHVVNANERLTIFRTRLIRPGMHATTRPFGSFAALFSNFTIDCPVNNFQQ